MRKKNLLINLTMQLDIIFENDHFIAVNKPSGLLSIPDRLGQEESLKDILKARKGGIYTVHRLDRDTSGVIFFGKCFTSGFVVL